MSNKPKLHHYIPRVYLKYFSDDGVGIYRYNKENDKIKSLPISKVGAINNFYTFIDSEEGRDTTIENPFFSQIEAEYDEFMDAVNSKKQLRSKRQFMATFLAVMYARVPAQRKNWERVNKEIMNDLILKSFKEHVFHGNEMEKIKKDFEEEKERPMTDEEEEEMKEYVKGLKVENTKNQDLSAMLIDIDVATTTLMNTSYFSVLTSRGARFITGDNPARAAAFLPLTPNKCLVSSQQKRSLTYIPVGENQVKKINGKVFEGADRYVFSEKKEDLKSVIQERS